MPILEQLFLNPFQKWSQYGRFPWTFLLHVVLLVVVTTQAALLFERDVQHVSRTVRHFAHLFVGTSMSEYGRPLAVTLHEPRGLQDAVRKALRNHFFINNVSIVAFQLADPEQLTVQVVWRHGLTDTWKVERSGFADQNGTSSESEAYLRKSVPFLYDPHLLRQVALMRMEHTFEELGFVEGSMECTYHWSVVTSFDGSQAGEFFGRVRSHASDCRAPPAHLLWLHRGCLVLALVSLVLVLRKFWRSACIARTLRANAEAWGALSSRDKMKLFSFWWILAIAMHVVQIVSCWVCLRESPEVGSRFQCVGFSCFLTWTSMCQYFESFPGYYMAFHTLRISAGRVARYLLSVGPLFVGFVLLGVCLFWNSSVFESPAAAVATLFSLMNGDMIHDAFDEVGAIGGMLAQVYLYVFLFVFIYVILNVNISIVTDAYERALRHPQTESAKLLRQQTREETERRRTPPPSAPVSPPGSPRRTRTFQGHMSPRFFESARIQEALAAAYPEQPLLGSGPSAPTRAEVDLVVSTTSNDSLISGLDTPLTNGAVTGDGAMAGDDLEMMRVSCGWDHFDGALEVVTAGVSELQRLTLPRCKEATKQLLLDRLEGLRQAVASVKAARQRAEEQS